MPEIYCRGVRGATTVELNSKEDILLATRQLLALMIRKNEIDSKDVASAIFTVTKDLDAEFPALAARQLGWIDVPLLCGYEVAVEGSLPMCIRVLVHWNTMRTQDGIEHIYIRDAGQIATRSDEVPLGGYGRAGGLDCRESQLCTGLISPKKSTD